MRAKWSSRRSGLAFVAAVAAAACGVHTTSSGGVKVTAVAPATGTIAGGPQVTITGSGFSNSTGHANVTFGAGTVVGDVVNDTTIHVPLPGSLACGKVDVQVANDHGDGILFNGFDYTGGSSALTITGVTPDNGDVAGGTSITITGSGFSGGVGLSIGGQLLTNVVVVNDTTITAVTPATTNGGAVDLVARNCAHQVQAAGAFVFTDGQNGGVVVFPLTHWPTPNVFGGTPPVDNVDPFVAFYQPTTEAMLAPIPADGTCQLFTGNPASNVTEIDGGSSVLLQSGSQQLTIAEQTTASGTYFEYFETGTDTNTAEYVSGGLYDLGAAGSATLPAFTTTSAFMAPATMVFSSATNTELYSNPVATVSKANGMPLTWTAASAQDQTAQRILIVLDGYDNSANPQETLICTALDNGSFTIPKASLQSMTNSTQAIVFTDRRRVGTFLNRGNGTTMTALGIYEQGGLVDLGP